MARRMELSFMMFLCRMCICQESLGMLFSDVVRTGLCRSLTAYDEGRVFFGLCLEVTRGAFYGIAGDE